MILAKGVSKFFGPNQVLQDISCEIPAGSLTALVGGNGAGKSTLLRILGGVLPPSAGSVVAGTSGERILSIRSAIRCGIRSAHQEGSLIPAWTVKEHFTHRGSPLASSWVGLAPDVPADSLIETLRPHERQLLEVSRALSFKPAVFLADEPAAGLSRAEKVRVYEALLTAANNGCAVLVATHDLEFALKQCHQIIALNKGQMTLRRGAQDCTLDMVLEAMGAENRQPVRFVQTSRNREAAEALSVQLGKGKTAFDVHTGEILGITGGSIAKEIFRVVYGLSHRFEAAAFLKGRELTRTPEEGLHNGVSYVSRERSTEWNFDGQSLQFNLVGAILHKLTRHSVIQVRNMERTATELKHTFEISAPSLTIDFESLSGGNRQKAVLARAAAASPHFLLLDEPFSGVDQPTRLKIFVALRTLVKAGTGVAIYSQEVTDLLNATDRVILLKDDQSVSEFISAETDAGQLETSLLLSSHQSNFAEFE